MKHFLICILMILVACNKQFQKDDNALTITAISTDFETKASETAFEAGDKIGIFLESSHGNNALYETTDGSTWRGYDNIYKVNAGEKATAYYPYSETATNLSAIEISGNVDFMITSATPITTTDNRASVALNFRHILSKLAVTMAIPEEIAGVKTVSLDSVVAKNVFRKAVVNIADGSISGLTDKGDIKVKGTEIIVIPQTVQKIEIVFKMANGKFERLAYNTPILLESGKKTTFNAVSNADLYFTSFLDLKSGETQADLPLSFYVAPGRTWELKSSEPWLTFSATTGVGAATVKVSVKSNSAYPLKPRTATITLNDDKPSSTPQKVTQNCARIPTVEIAGVNWTTANLIGTIQGQTANFTIETSPEKFGMFWKWGSLYMYARVSGIYPSEHWNGNATIMAATFPVLRTQDYDYGSPNLSSSWGAPVGDPCKALGSYRTPTSTQWLALLGSGMPNSTKFNNVDGYFLGPNAYACNSSTIAANCIFLPLAGMLDWYGGAFLYEGINGNYWSSSVFNEPCGEYIFLDQQLNITGAYHERTYGFSVRCVAE